MCVCVCVCVCVSTCSCPALCDPWTVACQDPLSMEIPNPGIKAMSLMSPALISGFSTTVPPGKPTGERYTALTTQEHKQLSVFTFYYYSSELPVQRCNTGSAQYNQAFFSSHYRRHRGESCSDQAFFSSHYRRHGNESCSNHT